MAGALSEAQPKVGEAARGACKALQTTAHNVAVSHWLHTVLAGRVGGLLGAAAVPL